MVRAALLSVGLSFLSSVAVPASPHVAPIDEESLVPAALGVRTDHTGVSWDFEANGTLGRVGGSFLAKGLELSIDGTPFTEFQPLMSRDGSLFVLSGRPIESLPGLRVQRRVHLLERLGIVRYTEIFRNDSSVPRAITVALDSTFSDSYRSYLTDGARAEAVVLNADEGGILVLPPKNTTNRAMVFSLAGKGAFVRPSIAMLEKDHLRFQYRLNIAPGETRIIFHQISQVEVSNGFDRLQMAQLFQPFALETILPVIPDPWIELVANVGMNHHEPKTDRFDTSSERLLGLERGSRDLLVLGDRSHLLGEAKGGLIELESSFGRSAIRFEEIAAIQGMNHRESESVKLLLNDGQILTGNVTIPDFSFNQKEGGSLPLDPHTLDRLIMAKVEASDDDEPNESTMPNEMMYLETHHGDRISVAVAESPSISASSAWGTLTFSLAHLTRLAQAEGAFQGHWVETTDGLRSLVFLGNQTLELAANRFGPIKVDAGNLKTLEPPRNGATASYHPEFGVQNVFHLSGDQVLVGDLDFETVVFFSEGVRFELPITSIKHIERVDRRPSSTSAASGERLSFRLDQWEGGVLHGRFETDQLSITHAGQPLSIPISALESWRLPSPDLTPQLQAEIKQLLMQLADDAWKVRERATQDLLAYGAVAEPVLLIALRESRDPEVVRRIERIINQIESTNP